MTKKLYLSNSQFNNYSDCQRLWYIDKVERIRPSWLGSPLLFGTAIDDTIEHILLNNEGHYMNTFYDRMTRFKVNGSSKSFPDDILSARFNASDLDINLIENKQLELFEQYCDTLDLETPDVGDFLETMKTKRKAKKALSIEEQKLFNFLCHQSLVVKGELMIEALKEWIDENIDEVIAVQKKIEAKNQEGDTLIGYLDFIVKLKDGRTVLIDLKTSSDMNRYYPTDSAEKSRQLGIYAHQTGVFEVAYLVVDKKIRKRKPRVRLKFVEGTITDEFLDDMFDEIVETTVGIKDKLKIGKKAFDKNSDLCYTRFGKGCDYKDYCNGGKMNGLEKV